MKKKIIAVSLITAMVVCNSITVWAADTWSNSGGSSKYTVGTGGTDDGTRDSSTSVTDDLEDVNSGQKDVKGTVDLGTAAASYSVIISWGALTYNKDNSNLTKSWDNGTASYDITNSNNVWNPTDAENGSDKITVTNKSNVPIKATFTGAFDTSGVKNDKGITVTAGDIRIKDASATGNDATGVTNTSSLELVKSTSADGVVGEKYVGVIGTITNVKNLSTSDITLGTVTIKIEEKKSS